jgi:hypothetical protein
LLPYRFLTLGGIQIAGDNDNVGVHENQILGGAGNGITLGSDPLAEEPRVEPVVRDFTLPEGELEVHIHSEEGEPLPNTTVFVSGRYIDISGVDGTSVINVERGLNRIGVIRPGYEVSSMSVEDTPEGEPQRIIALMSSVPPSRPLEIPAWVSNIKIEGNVISRMGRSGIGIPLPEQRNVMRSKAISLSIWDNHIHHCLQQPSSGTSPTRGEGGISLGDCELLTIRDNLIEDNGRADWEPVCGIFVAHAAQVRISGNQIANNGPFAEQLPSTPLTGVRGGIVLPLVTSVLTSGAKARATPTAVGTVDWPDGIYELVKNVAAVQGGYAAHIHNNQVEQPVGQALRLIALGAVMVNDNHFNVDLAIDANHWPQRLAGALFLLNLGLPPHTESSPLCKPISGRLGWLPKLLTGNTAFNNNRTQLGLNYASMSAQLIASCDDLGAGHNYSVVLEELGQLLVTNTLLLATTVRASDNRFQEPVRN